MRKGNQVRRNPIKLNKIIKNEKENIYFKVFYLTNFPRKNIQKQSEIIL